MKKVEVLDSEQLKVVNSKAKNIVVVAGAGAGKTKVLTERVRYLLDNKVKAKNIVCITFTNLAADEMHERLQDIKGVNSAFIGTIHAFAKKVLDTTDDYFELFTEQKNIDFHSRLIRKYCKTLTTDKWGTFYDIEKKVKLGYLNEDKLHGILNTTERMELDLLHREKGKEDPNYPETIETLCEQQGIITFDELLRRATTYFASSKSYPEYVIVDEFQDVGQLEYNFLQSLKAKNYFLVGDEKQAIYGFRGGDINIFNALLKNKEYEVHKLVNNYRNAKDIIELAESVQVQMSNITPLKMVAKATHKGFITLGSTAQLDELIKELGKSEELGKWFILTRSNKDLQMVADKLAQSRINHISFKREGMSLKELRQLMSLNSVKLLTVHTSKGLENDNVIVFGKNFKLQRPDWHKNDDETKVLYVAITRAKTNLIILT